MAVLPILAEKFDVQTMISLQGGEPFLYWEEKIVPLSYKIRELFPNTRINIFTNGHLLGKNLNKYFDLINNVNHVTLTISRHLAGDLTSTVGQHWQDSIDTLLNHPLIVKIHDDHYHVQDKIDTNIYFYSTKYWSSHYYETDQGKLKPHATNDPANSMKYGCTGSLCSFLKGTKLYKCGRLANLSNLLGEINQLDDPDWKPYIDYQPLDLLNIDQTLFDNFVASYGKAISECDMCQNRPSDQLWADRTWNMIFHKKNTP